MPCMFPPAFAAARLHAFDSAAFNSARSPLLGLWRIKWMSAPNPVLMHDEEFGGFGRSNVGARARPSGCWACICSHARVFVSRRTTTTHAGVKSFYLLCRRFNAKVPSTFFAAKR